MISAVEVFSKERYTERRYFEPRICGLAARDYVIDAGNRAGLLVRSADLASYGPALTFSVTCQVGRKLAAATIRQRHLGTLSTLPAMESSMDGRGRGSRKKNEENTPVEQAR